MSRLIAPVLSMDEGGRVARLTIGSGSRRNALTAGGWVGIERAIHAMAADADLRAVVIEGAAGGFCAGSDIREWVQATPEVVEQSFARMEAACTAIEALAVPVIAKVRGAAAGAGCQLALACDMRILADNATIGMPIALLGILVSPAFANRLTVHAGAAVARELLYTGRMVGAPEAVRLGLANACLPGDELDGHVDGVLDSILRASAPAIRAAKRAVAVVEAPGRTAATAAATAGAVATGDFSRGIDAFLHRRHVWAAKAGR